MKLNWDNAHKWEEISNETKDDIEPTWSWDCGFKLDYDGSLLSVSSRFYPPHKNDGNYWQGELSIKLLGEVIQVKEFKEDTLDILKVEVDKYMSSYIKKIESKLI